MGNSSKRLKLLLVTVLVFFFALPFNAANAQQRPCRTKEKIKLRFEGVDYVSVGELNNTGEEQELRMNEEFGNKTTTLLVKVHTGLWVTLFWDRKEVARGKISCGAHEGYHGVEITQVAR